MRKRPVFLFIAVLFSMPCLSYGNNTTLTFECHTSCNNLFNDSSALDKIISIAEPDLSNLVHNVTTDNITIYLALLRIYEYKKNWRKVIAISDTLKEHMSAVEYYRYVFFPRLISLTKTITPRTDKHLETIFFSEISNSPYAASYCFKFHNDYLTHEYNNYIEKYLTNKLNNQKRINIKTLSKIVSIINYKTNMLPMKDKLLQLSEKGQIAIRKKHQHKNNIWNERDIEVLPEHNNSIVAIWDSGVDTRLLEENRIIWKNKLEIPFNNKDDDNNGIIDDAYGIVSHSYLDNSKQLLKDLKLQELSVEEAYDFSIKWLACKYDLEQCDQNALSSYLDNTSETRKKKIFNDMEAYIGYAHGTHVAMMAAEKNNNIRILSIRENRSLKPSEEISYQAQADIISKDIRKTIQYLRKTGARIVNMSFGYSSSLLREEILKQNPELGTAKANEIASRMLDIIDDSLRKAIKNAPDLLFIAAAGNSSMDLNTTAFYPAAYSYNNLIVVGGADKFGYQSFISNYGKVDIWAYYEGVSFIPGGKKMLLRGTSQAAPRVTNTAAKLLSLYPDISTRELRDALLDAATTSNDHDKIKLLNPRGSLAILEKQHGKRLISP